jgi:predicted signal transduction protein with EAL and GGDEF domain
VDEFSMASRPRPVIAAQALGGDIVRYVSTRYEVAKRKAAEVELRRMAEIDALTGLANRARFSHEVNQRVANAAMDGADFSASWRFSIWITSRI